MAILSRNQRSCEVTSAQPANSNNASSRARSVLNVPNRSRVRQATKRCRPSAKLQPSANGRARHARKNAHSLLLIAALEVKATEIGTRAHLKLADLQNVEPARNRLKHCLIVGQSLSSLIHGCNLDRIPQNN